LRAKDAVATIDEFSAGLIDDPAFRYRKDLSAPCFRSTLPRQSGARIEVAAPDHSTQPSVHSLEDEMEKACET
jgi:hypothetical protein